MCWLYGQYWVFDLTSTHSVEPTSPYSSASQLQSTTVLPGRHSSQRTVQVSILETSQAWLYGCTATVIDSWSQPINFIVFLRGCSAHQNYCGGDLWPWLCSWVLPCQSLDQQLRRPRHRDGFPESPDDLHTHTHTHTKKAALTKRYQVCVETVVC